MDLFPLIVVGVIAFAATNVDDSLLLVGFFGDRRYRIRHVFAGQAFGIGLLMLISLMGALLAPAIPGRWIGLLGLLPIVIGARKLIERRRGGGDEEQPVIDSGPIPAAPGWKRAMAVAGVTLANGSDNIGVYTPLFASRTPGQTALLLAVFAGMLAVWLFGTLYLTRRSVVAGRVGRIGHAVFPYALVGLGITILFDAFVL